MQSKFSDQNFQIQMALCINPMVNLFLIISLIVSICKTQSDSDATSQPTSQPTLSPIPFLSESDCEVSFPSINTSFNLCLLKLPNNGIGDRSYYEVQDYRYSGINEKNETATYLYHFNIGGPVLAEDSQCVITNTTDNPGYCSDIAGEGQCNTALTPINGTSWAYQLRVSNTTSGYIDDCWRLSDETGITFDLCIISKISIVIY